VFRRCEEPTTAELAAGALDTGLRVHAPRVSGDFFVVMRVPLVRGRTFTTRDDTLSEPVAIVSQHLADALWPASAAVGEYVAWAAPDGALRAPLRVVGVAADRRDVSLSGDDARDVSAMHTAPGVNPLLLLRGRGDTLVAETAIRRIVEAAGPGLSVLRRAKSLAVAGGRHRACCQAKKRGDIATRRRHGTILSALDTAAIEHLPQSNL
jgi:hypothetical protein